MSVRPTASPLYVTSNVYVGDSWGLAELCKRASKGFVRTTMVA